MEREQGESDRKLVREYKGKRERERIQKVREGEERDEKRERERENTKSERGRRERGNTFTTNFEGKVYLISCFSVTKLTSVQVQSD